MVRSAIANAGDALTDDNDALPDLSRAQPAGVRWQGSGGRWLVWAGRAVVWAVLLLIGYRGVLAIVTSIRPSRAAPAQVTTVRTIRPDLPYSLAGAFAYDFGEVYLNYGPATAAARSTELAQFLPPGADPQLGWDGVGSQHVQAEQIASITATGHDSLVVTLLATLTGGRMVELAVPVYAGRGGLSVSGRPAFLAPPARAAPSVPSTATADPVAEATLQRQLPAFFTAYASGDAAILGRFTAPGARLRGLDGLVSFGGIDSVYARPGGAKRAVAVTVTWKIASAAVKARPRASAPATLQMTYQLTVLRQGTSWDVQSIGAVASAQGPP